MNLSKTAKYAIRVISYMALKDKELYSASYLIKELKISDKYLKSILTTLSRKSIIKSVQGRYGGFQLNKNVDAINLYDIISTVEDIEKYYQCLLGLDDCSNKKPCSLHHNWRPLRDNLISFLQETTIAEIIKNPSILKY